MAATGARAAHLRVGVMAAPAHAPTAVEGAQAPCQAARGHPTNASEAHVGVGPLLASQDAESSRDSFEGLRGRGEPVRLQRVDVRSSGRGRPEKTAVRIVARFRRGEGILQGRASDRFWWLWSLTV